MADLKIRNSKFPIRNSVVNGWPTPAALPWSNAGSANQSFDPCSSEPYVLLLATFSNSLSHFRIGLPAEPSLRPFWHRFSVKPGLANHSLSIYKEPSNLCRNSRRPRASRDFTVPMLICSAAAISSYVKPSTSLSTTASR